MKESVLVCSSKYEMEAKIGGSAVSDLNGNRLIRVFRALFTKFLRIRHNLNTMRLSESMRKYLKNYETPSTIFQSLSYPSPSFTFLPSPHRKSSSRRGNLSPNHAISRRSSTPITAHKMVAHRLLHWRHYLLRHRRCPRGNMDLALI